MRTIFFHHLTTKRIIPIHSKIYDLVVQKYNEAVKINSPYLINYTQKSNSLLV